MLDLCKFFYQFLARFIWVEPELGAVGDGGDNHRFVEKAEVGGGDALDGVAKDFEAGYGGETFLA